MLWFKMPKNLGAMGFELKHVALIAEILYFSNSKTNEIYLKKKSIMTKYALSSRNYHEIISLLLSNHLVTKGTKKGQYFYNVNWDCVTNSLPSSNHDVTNSLSSCNSLTIDKNKNRKELDNNNNIINNIIDLDGEEIDTKKPKFDFEYIYALYPKKVGKTKGMIKCKSQIKTLEKYDQLVDAVNNYKKQTAKTESKYIKHFATFMSCWEDYIEIDDSTKTENEFLNFNLVD